MRRYRSSIYQFHKYLQSTGVPGRGLGGEPGQNGPALWNNLVTQFSTRVVCPPGNIWQQLEVFGHDNWV